MKRGGIVFALVYALLHALYFLLPTGGREVALVAFAVVGAGALAIAAGACFDEMNP